MKRIFTTNINAALDSVEDKEMALEQLIKDMSAEVRKHKQLVADAIVHLRKLEKDAEVQEKMAEEYRNKARMILEDDDESNDFLAKEALARMKECQRVAAEYRRAAEKQRVAVEKLKKNLEQMERKVEEARRKKEILIARKRAAEAQMSIAEAASADPTSEAFAEFDRIEEQIEDMSLKAEVQGELAAESGGVDLQLEQITFDSDVEEEFKKLLAETKGALPASQEPKAIEKDAGKDRE